MSDEPEEDAPLSELRDRLDERATEAGADTEADTPLSELAREAGASTESERAELFEEVEVGDIDAEALWEAVVEEGAPPEEVLGEPAGPKTAAAEPAAVDGEPAVAATDEHPDAADSADEQVIDKREYCQRCEHFSSPPGVACSNEETEILAMVENDSFRVRNCPKVGEADGEFQSMVNEE